MSSINIIKWILFMASLAVMKSAAAAGNLTAPSDPMASVDVTNTVTSHDLILEWLKITAVPLGVFLIGACTWGCIKNTVVWRRLTGRGGDESDAPEEDEVRPAERPTDSSRGESDLEVGLELSHRRMDAGLAMSGQTLQLTMQQPALEFPNDEGRSAATNVAAQLEKSQIKFPYAGLQER